jgi:hypothetical protein
MVCFQQFSIGAPVTNWRQRGFAYKLDFLVNKFKEIVENHDIKHH